MSKVVKIKSQLKQEKNKSFLKVVLSLFLAILFAVFGLVTLFAILLKKSTLHMAVPVIFILLAFAGLIVFLVFKKEYGILQSGVRGEETTLKILRKLPKEFTVLTNPVIHNRGAVNELDFVVVSKNGVFIIESKNYRGIVCGKTSNSNWKQIKHGKNGKTFEKEVSNPAKQSFRQKRRLEELFRDLRITATVYPVLYFVDDRTELKIQDDADLNVAIINDENTLLQFIQNTKGREKVSSEELAKIIRQFKR